MTSKWGLKLVIMHPAVSSAIKGFNRIRLEVQNSNGKPLPEGAIRERVVRYEEENKDQCATRGIK